MKYSEAEAILTWFRKDDDGNRIGYLRGAEGLTHEVYVHDVRETFGRTDVLVSTPYSEHEVWVSKDRCLSV